MDKLAENKCFGGVQLRCRHPSDALNCVMTFSVFLPPQAQEAAVPALYWLSGLTCTDENFVQKAGAQQYAAEHGIAVIAPDTSPRGEDVPDDPQGAWDFGLGAGFYVNATRAPWKTHYQMESYIRDELPACIEANLPVTNRRSISGHSMGGHGALTLALKNPDRYQSVSAFAPISSPLNCPWGEKALGHYLGDDKETWKDYDSCELIRAASGKKFELLVDQGSADNFLEEQLKPELLKEACAAARYPLELRMQEGYDHSYFFIATFIEDHIAFHARHLLA